jgi:hypothetical protein
MSTTTPQNVTVLDGTGEPHEAVLILDTRPRTNDEGYTWRGQITAVEGDEILAAIKSSKLSSGCTMLTSELEGRYEITLRKTPTGSFIALGIGRVPLSNEP